MNFSPLWISIKTSLLATLITFILGIIVSYLVVNYKGRFKGFIDGIFTLPLILPPTVLGFFLLLICGKNGPIGKLLKLFDTNIIFSWTATVIAATVVAFPMMYRTTRSSFEQIDPNIISAARTLGLSEFKIFYKIAIPLAWPGIIAGIVLSFARAMGEFGATLMIAGNIPGKTQTMPLAIFFAVFAETAVTCIVLPAGSAPSGAFTFTVTPLDAVALKDWAGMETASLFVSVS